MHTASLFPNFPTVTSASLVSGEIKRGLAPSEDGWFPQYPGLPTALHTAPPTQPSQPGSLGPKGYSGPGSVFRDPWARPPKAT